MGFSCGIVGLPNVGKSTLFNALLSEVQAAVAANYPFCTIEPNTGRVAVPDERLQHIDNIIKAKRIIPTFMEFVDIAGLVKGASRGEGLGNQFLGNIREVDAIIHVVRCFDDQDIVHVDGEPNPSRDIDTINTELIYCDFETIKKSIDKLSRQLKGNDKKISENYDCALRLQAHLDSLKPARAFKTYTEQEELYISSLHLLSAKPVLYAANVAENDLADEGIQCAYVQDVQRIAAQENAQVVLISAKIEHELMQLDEQDAQIYMEHLQIKESGLKRLIKAGYTLLGLQTYFTAGVEEVRAWTIPKNCRAPQAAGVIHSDFEKGYICAEVYNYDDLLRLGSEAKVKEAGLYRKEGREYICQDGDIMHFLFNL